MFENTKESLTMYVKGNRKSKEHSHLVIATSRPYWIINETALRIQICFSDSTLVQSLYLKRLGLNT